MRQSVPERCAGSWIESIDDARMGLAVLVDGKTVSTFRGCAAMFVIANARKLMRPSPELERNTRTGKHARFLPTVHSDACTGCGKCEKCACWNNRQSRCYRCH